MWGTKELKRGGVFNLGGAGGGGGGGGSCCQRALLEKEQVWGRWQGGSERLLTWVRSSKAERAAEVLWEGGRLGLGDRFMASRHRGASIPAHGWGF